MELCEWLMKYESKPHQTFLLHTRPQEDSTAHNKKTRLTNWLTLIAIVIYAGLTAWMALTSQNIAKLSKDQFSLAHDQLLLARDQFTKDQRPYVWITRPSFDPLKANSQLTGKVILRNFGKSPALNIRNDISNIYYGPNASKSVDNILDGWKTFKIVHEGHPSITLPPENPQDPDSYLRLTVVGFVPEKGPNAPISDEDVRWISSHEGGAIMAGNIQYNDMAGNSYYTEYCIVRIMDGSNAPCSSHNEIH